MLYLEGGIVLLKTVKIITFIVGIIMWIGTFVWLWGNLTNVSFFPRLALVNLISSVVFVAQIAFGMVFSIAIEDFVLR